MNDKSQQPYDYFITISFRRFVANANLPNNIQLGWFVISFLAIQTNEQMHFTSDEIKNYLFDSPKFRKLLW